MPQTVLGLDISQSTIKAVLFTPRGLTGGRIIAAQNLDINACVCNLDLELDRDVSFYILAILF